MTRINKDRLYDIFRELVNIDSLSFRERAFADALKDRLLALGLEVYEDASSDVTGSNAGNILARFPMPGRENEPAVLFSAHMDTVAPGEGKQAILHDDGRITSEGSTVLGADDAGGIAEILEAVSEIIEEGAEHHNIELLFPVAEESYCIGSYAFDKSLIKSDRAYFLDKSGNVGGVSISEPTLISYEVGIRGRAAHAGFDPESGISAIQAASLAISRLTIGRVDPDTTLAVGIIEGGVATNVVPDRTVVKGELRSQRHERALELLESVRRTFEQAAEEIGAQCEFHYTQHLTAYSVPDDSPAFVALDQAMMDEEVSIIPERSQGGSDANAFRASGIDALCVANAMWNIHTTEEYTHIDEMAKVCGIVKRLMSI